ncbi:MAG: enoyl-CoA hydratase/isomerase family protein [Chloroflexi bacterium]|nr:enoyl-CoA hydratase/isomerase family protein [Chloroflexota bacterium]
MDYGQYEFIVVEKDEDGIATVTLNRPERRNAINPEMHKELESLFSEISKDRDVRCIVLTGAGTGFSAGGDAKVLQAGTWRDRAQEVPLAEVRRLLLYMLEVEQPIVAAVNGDAAGLGATLALFSDIIVAAEDARISDAHVLMGLVAGDGGVVIWPWLVGMARAKEYLLLGRWITGKQAAEMGMVNYAVPAAEALPKAMELARELASGSPLAIRWTKFCLNKLLRDHVNLAVDTSAILESITLDSDDLKEAATAFLEKRKPQFKGS